MMRKTRITAIATTALTFIFLTATILLLVYQEKCNDDLLNERETLEFFTDKNTYSSGEDVIFVLQNNGTENLLYDTSLRETLQIFGPMGQIVVMLPHILTDGLADILPGENLTWTWNQTYYLGVLEEGELSPTWDHRSWTQVPKGKYTARIVFGDIEKEARFSIGD